MKKVKRILGIVIIIGTIVMSAAWTTGIVNAADSKSSRSPDAPGFSVTAMLPGSNKQSSYFNFKVTPNQEKIINIKISNNDNESRKFDIVPNNAFTNENGIIDYTQHVKKSSLLKISLTDMISNSKGKTITVPSKKTKTVSFKIKIPADKFDGIILGGFLVRPRDKSENKQTKNKQVSTSAYRLLKIKIYQNKDSVVPKINYYSVKYDLIHALPSIIVNMDNAAPTTVAVAKADISVTNKKGKEVFSKTFKNMSLAPNDDFNYVIPLGNKQLQAGTYEFHMIMTGKNDQRRLAWSYDDSFKVDRKKAKMINTRVVSATKAKKNYTWAYIIGCIVAFIFIGLIFFITVGRKNKDKNY